MKRTIMAYHNMLRLIFVGLCAFCINLSPVLATEVPSLNVGTTFKDCEDCPRMVVVPAGSFVMGKDKAHKYERPAHPVTVLEPFAIGAYEITFDEWQYCFDEGGCSRIPDDHKWGRGNRPIMNVTLAEVNSYIDWLSTKTGKQYRLPSEAEWEYAARAGTTTDYWWGDEVGDNVANCRNCPSPWYKKKKSAPVGSFQPNPFGLYDVHGNQWEWTADCWNPNHEGASGTTKTRLTGDCSQSVIRSGSWYYYSKNMRSSWRFKNGKTIKSYFISFRVLRDVL